LKINQNNERTFQVILKDVNSDFVSTESKLEDARRELENARSRLDAAIDAAGCSVTPSNRSPRNIGNTRTSAARVKWEQACVTNPVLKWVDKWVVRLGAPVGLAHFVLEPALFKLIPETFSGLGTQAFANISTTIALCAAQTGVLRNIPFIGVSLKWLRGEIPKKEQEDIAHDFQSCLASECAKSAGDGERMTETPRWNQALNDDMAAAIGTPVEDFETLEDFFLEEHFIELVAEHAGCLPHQVPPLGDNVAVYEQYCFAHFTQACIDLHDNPGSLNAEQQKLVDQYMIEEVDADTPDREDKERILKSRMSAARRYAQTLFDFHQSKAWRMRTVMGVSSAFALSAALGPFAGFSWYPVVCSALTAAGQKGLHVMRGKPKGLRFDAKGKPVLSVKGLTDLSGGLFDARLVTEADSTAKPKEGSQEEYILELIKKIPADVIKKAKDDKEIRSAEELAVALELPLRRCLTGKKMRKPRAQGETTQAEREHLEAKKATRTANAALAQAKAMNNTRMSDPDVKELLAELGRQATDATGEEAKAKKKEESEKKEMAQEISVELFTTDPVDEAGKKFLNKARTVWASEAQRLWKDIQRKREGTTQHKVGQWFKRGGNVTIGGVAAAEIGMLLMGGGVSGIAPAALVGVGAGAALAALSYPLQNVDWDKKKWYWRWMEPIVTYMSGKNGAEKKTE
ncbi:MAG: hypothetical protein PHZ00_03025, partial [Candidatus Peribacteraceae bacterium]|nr:hypothetical protein [Candidatus Peribacteraceae bacterium]